MHGYIKNETHKRRSTKKEAYALTIRSQKNMEYELNSNNNTILIMHKLLRLILVEKKKESTQQVNGTTILQYFCELFVNVWLSSSISLSAFQIHKNYTGEIFFYHIIQGFNVNVAMKPFHFYTNKRCCEKRKFHKVIVIY